jgi:hypothetical protein
MPIKNEGGGGLGGYDGMWPSWEFSQETGVNTVSTPFLTSHLKDGTLCWTMFPNVIKVSNDV